MASQVRAAISRISSGIPIITSRTMAPWAVSINAKSVRCGSAIDTCAAGTVLSLGPGPIVGFDPLSDPAVTPEPSAATSTVPTSSWRTA